MVLWLTGFLVLIPVYYVAERLRGEAAWRAYERDAAARGVKLEFSEFIPPRIPDPENFASIPMMDAVFRASAADQPIPNPFELPGKKDDRPKLSDTIKQKRIDLVAWRAYFVKFHFLPAAGESAAADVLSALDHYTGPLQELRDASARPRCRFPVAWEKAEAAALPHLALLQSATTILALRATCHLALGDSPAAYDDIRDGLRLATVIADEPSLISGLVRVANVVVLQRCVWDGLAGRQWAEPELRKIEDDLSKCDWLSDFVFSMSSERGGENIIFDRMMRDPRMFDTLLESQGVHGSSTLKPQGWFFRNKVTMNRYFDETLARMEPRQRRYFGDRPVPSSPPKTPELSDRIIVMPVDIFVPVLENVGKKYVRAGSETDESRLACALERFWLAHGSYPEQLSDLAPDFIAKIPAEIVNGQGYHYRRTEDGRFLLYSVGIDLHDDGGVINPNVGASSQKDWVWRYPAK